MMNPQLTSAPSLFNTGWRYRQDPNIADAVNSMNPQAGSGGGYKPQTCKKKGG